MIVRSITIKKIIPPLLESFDSPQKSLCLNNCFLEQQKPKFSLIAGHHIVALVSINVASFLNISSLRNAIFMDSDLAERRLLLEYSFYSFGSRIEP